MRRDESALRYYLNGISRLVVYHSKLIVMSNMKEDLNRKKIFLTERSELISRKRVDFLPLYVGLTTPIVDF